MTTKQSSIVATIRPWLPILGSALALSCGAPADRVPASQASAPTPAQIEPPVASTAPAPAATPAATADRLEADTMLAMGSGASITVLGGWYRTRYPAGHVLIEDPERAIRLFLVEVPRAAGEAAVAKAWAQVGEKPAFALDRVLSPPASDGWEEIAVVNYKLPAQPTRIQQGIVLAYGQTSYVVLIDGELAAISRRGAQVNTIIGGLRAPGMSEPSLAERPARTLTPERLATFEAFIADARQKAGVPGVSVAVVQDGKVVFAKGFGVRTQGQNQPVDADTLMMIGSVNKPLTTLLMASLVDEGKLAWDTPVTKILPDFALGDAEATQQLLVKHTACACTGMPRRDMHFVFEYGRQTPESLLASMRTMKPTTGFGETFQYSNQLVAAGGYIAARAFQAKGVLGPAYDQAMQERVFGPMGMKATTVDMAKARRARNRAMPHGMLLDGTAQAFDLKLEGLVIPVRPAGGAWSSANDMARWVLTELGRGQAPTGKRVASEAEVTRRWQPGVKINSDNAYGLGLGVGRYKGVQMIGHGGNTLGFSADAAWLPEKGVGIVVLSNATGALANGFIRAVRTRLWEIVLEAPEEAGEQLAYALGERVKGLEEAKQGLGSEISEDWLRMYGGTYKHEALGEVRIAKQGKRVVLDVGEWQSAIVPKQEADGTASIVLIDPPYSGFVALFPKLRDGKPVLELPNAQETYVFVRQ